MRLLLIPGRYCSTGRNR